MANESRSPHGPTRVVLESVPRVSFDLPRFAVVDGVKRSPEGVPFPSCLRAYLEFTGEDYGSKTIIAHGSAWRLDNTYVYLMGTSGAAFRLNWKPGWHLDNPAIFLMSDDPATPFRRGLEAVGSAYEIVHKEEGRDNEAYFRSRIIESIRDKGRPVLAHGVTGPPEDCIIAGYDENGGVLIGWSFFQDFPEFNAGVEFEPCGYFRKRNWFKDTWSLIVIGDKQERPPLGDIYSEALKWAVKVVRTPVTYGDRHNGLAAYAAWSEALLRDDDFPADQMPVLRERYQVHDDAVGTVAEGRWYAAQFLRQMAHDEPAMKEELVVAAACYEAEHDLMWQIWGLVGGLGRSDEQINKLAEPEVRRQVAAVILESRDKDADAADNIEQALAK